MSDIDFIKRELTFNQPIEKVWDAITQPDQIANWFGDTAIFELQEGAEGYFEWRTMCEGKYAMKVISVNPMNYFAYMWMNDPDVPFEASDATLVEWTLNRTVNGKTHLVLIESGFKQKQHRKMNIQGWHQELLHLLEYLS